MRDAISINAIIVRNNEVIMAEMGNETVMMSLQQGNYYGIDPVGSAIWALLKEPVQVSELCDRLTASFDVSPETCRRHVLEFLDTLWQEHLVEVVDEVHP